MHTYTMPPDISRYMCDCTELVYEAIHLILAGVTGRTNHYDQIQCRHRVLIRRANQIGSIPVIREYH